MTKSLFVDSRHLWHVRLERDCHRQANYLVGLRAN
jgi:hypothetical protein